ncbi:MAG: ATP-binding cassette domain-containing protein [Pseudomonadales bacterium]|nr:ATP-binding cassette domain-containing protein [Pseudomonadales bacterium]
MVEAIIEVSNLSTGYKGQPVLQEVTFSVRPKEVLAIIGPNGSGKSTLLKTIFGLIQPQSGTIQVNDLKVSTDSSPRKMLEQRVCFAPQGNSVFASMTVLDNCRLAIEFSDQEQPADEVMKGIFEAFPVLKAKSNEKAGNLSGGEKQMLGIACLLATTPQVALLDEPTLGLSPHLAKATLERIRALSDDLSVTVLIAEQRVKDILRVCDTVLLLRDGGASYFGGPDSINGHELTKYAW